MGERVAIGLDGAERATEFGSAMAGLRGATHSRTLERTGITVCVPAERLYHVDGTPREASVPPFPIESGSSGAAAVLEEALNWIQAPRPRPWSGPP